MGTAIKHPVLDRVKPSFVISDCPGIIDTDIIDDLAMPTVYC